MALEITPLVRRGIRIFGSYGAKTRTDVPILLDLAKNGAIDVGRVVMKRYRLEEVNSAYQALGRGEIVGRAIVVMD